ncbi:MAG: DNA-binding protein [Lachnospiraceae bacterium]|nr:DNA-binding protein [Lachnospiraceae bacterium]
MSKSDPEKWLAEVFELSMLYDFYGELLSDSSKKFFEGYVLDDMTLAEMSEETGISRQGIYDNIKRTIDKLHSYEDKLHLVKKYGQVADHVSKIKELAASMESDNNKAVGEIIKLSDLMLEEF